MSPLLRFTVTNPAGLKRLLACFAVLLVLVLLYACSPQNTSLAGKAFHNTAAHYNGYYYAREEVRKIEKTIWSSHVDDYNRVLRLYPPLDSALAKGYDKEIQEAVKMASIAIQRHPNSKWVDDAYILVGKARLYSLDWGNAIQTFKYVNTKSLDLNARHAAIIGLIRTFTEHQEFPNAQAAIDFLQKQPLNTVNRKQLLLEKAYFYQMQGNYDYMVRNLTEADPFLRKKDRRGRIDFIIGQVYQKLGFESEAYNYYKKCLSTNPEYEVDFYARLYMAQVTEISRSKNVNAARKSFRKLMKDAKNKDFRDKIYYEMGVFELKQKNLKEAIADFNQSVRVGTNKRVDGEAYLRLGEIYYDTLKNFPLSQAYYDSAIQSLPRDYEGYAAIKARQEILNEFVKHLNTIKWQDSLLRLANLDSTALRVKVDSAVKAREALAAQKAGKKKRGSNRVEINANNNNNVFGSGNDDNTNTGTDETGGWYFANPSAMGIGQTEFRRIWGQVPLEDNWRRSSRTVLRDQATTAAAEGAASAGANAPAAANTPAPDPVTQEYNRIAKELPRTDQQKKEALAKIETAYFSLGDIYYFKLLEKDNAVLYYQQLLRRFPDTEYEPEVLYKLYLIYKDTDPSKAEQFATLLKTKHPETTYAKILINPNFIAESLQAVEKQKALYKQAYEMYEQESYRPARQLIAEALAIGNSDFSPRLELLQVLILGKTEDINQYQYALDEFGKKYAGTDVGNYAKKLLDASRDFQKTMEKRKGIQYIRSFDEPHYFVMVYAKQDNLTNTATALLEKFNQANFRDAKLKTSNLVLTDDYIITMVTELPKMNTALQYLQSFTEKLPAQPELRNHKFYTFVITKSNFDIFYRTKGLDEYLRFFDKNYPAENQ